MIAAIKPQIEEFFNCRFKDMELCITPGCGCDKGQQKFCVQAKIIIDSLKKCPLGEEKICRFLYARLFLISIKKNCCKGNRCIPEFLEQACE